MNAAQTLVNDIKILSEKAQNTHDSNEAMRFSQAVLNTAHALSILGATLAPTKDGDL